VWVAISRKRITGPIFFYNSVTSDRYCNDILYPFIGELNENKINNTWFQQDSATALTAGQSMTLLSEIFGDCVISKDLWPPRSPDLNPPDYYLWGAAKVKVYEDNPHSTEELKAAITAYIGCITSEELKKVFGNKIKRVQACLNARRGHFEHLL
jgi:hypothetical protein